MAKKNEVAVEKTAVHEFHPSMYKKVKDIVLPTISIKGMNEGDALYFEVESDIRRIQQVDEKTGEIKLDKNDKPATLPIIIVRNLANNSRGHLVLPAIVVRGLEEAGDIKGRKFAMCKGKSLGVGKANLWEVCEIAE